MSFVIKRNNINIFGEGDRVMLFAHGYGCNQKMWRFITPAFEKEYKIILIDLVGSGDSDIEHYDTEKYNSLQGYAADIVEICEELTLSKVIFIGHSVSSMIGLHAAILAPHLFEKLIMVGPSPRYINEEGYIGGFDKGDILELLETLDSNYLGWSSAIAPVIMDNPDKPELTDELNNSFCQTDPVVAKQFARVTFLGDDKKHLNKLTTDTLILQCTSDVIAPLEVGKYVHSSLQSSTLKLLEVTGHCPHMSAPEETAQAIKDFLYVSL